MYSFHSVASRCLICQSIEKTSAQFDFILRQSLSDWKFLWSFLLHSILSNNCGCFWPVCSFFTVSLSYCSPLFCRWRIDQCSIIFANLCFTETDSGNRMAKTKGCTVVIKRSYLIKSTERTVEQYPLPPVNCNWKHADLPCGQCAALSVQPPSTNATIFLLLLILPSFPCIPSLPITGSGALKTGLLILLVDV